MIRQGGILFSSLFYFTQLYETVSEDSVTKNLHYLYAPSGLFAIFATSDNTETMHYTFTDHQGSLVAYTSPLNQPFSVQCTKNSFSFVFIREIAYFCKKVSRYARNDFDT